MVSPSLFFQSQLATSQPLSLVLWTQSDGLTVLSTFLKISLASSKSQLSSMHSRSRLLGRSSSRKELARLWIRRTWWACSLLENTESVWGGGRSP